MNKENINILLADDDKSDCYLFERVLEMITVSTTFNSVHDGEKLMEFLNDKTRALPTVLFLDLNMPRKNGFKCLEEIKLNKKLMQMPVIIFSTSFEQDIADQLYKNGAHFYICKPNDFNHLKEVIYQALQLIKAYPDSQPPKEIFLLSNLKYLHL